MIGKFYFAKVFSSYNNHLINGKHHYKWRPVLIIGKSGNFYKVIPITSHCSSYNYSCLDVFTEYNFPKHSYILCGEECLILEKNIGHFISVCKNDDFEYIIKKHNIEKNKKL